MSRIETRVEKLEQRAGVGEKDSPVIRYVCNQEDAEEGAAAARAEAVAAWEAENGPLGDREPFFIVRCLVSPPARREAEAAAPSPQEPETNVTPFLAR